MKQELHVSGPVISVWDKGVFCYLLHFDCRVSKLVKKKIVSRRQCYATTSIWHPQIKQLNALFHGHLFKMVAFGSIHICLYC